MVSTPTISVTIHTDEHGRVRIANTRVALGVVIARYQQHETPEQIHEGFPTLKLADIYAVITYYLNNRDEIDAFLRQQDEEEKEYLRKMESEHPEMFVLRISFGNSSLNERNECAFSPTKTLTTRSYKAY